MTDTNIGIGLSRGTFSTSIENAIINDSIELLQETLVEYLKDTRNYTLKFALNDYLASILTYIEEQRSIYSVEENPNLNSELHDVENRACVEIIKAFGKEFNEEIDFLRNRFNSDEEFFFATQVLFHFIYCNRLKMMEDFIYDQVILHREELTLKYKPLFTTKEVTYQNLRKEVIFENRDAYIVTVFLREIIRDYLGSPENFRVDDILSSCNDLNDEQYMAFYSFIEGNLDFIPNLFKSILESRNYHFLENSVRQRVITFYLINKQQQQVKNNEKESESEDSKTSN